MHYFDITNLVQFLQESNHVTGIQRLLLETITVPHYDSQYKNNFECCYFGQDKQWHSVPYEFFVNAVLKEYPSKEVSKNIFSEYSKQLNGNPVIPWSKGDTLILIGATWGIRSFFETLHEVKAKGVSCITFLHDLLPITHPEFFTPDYDVMTSYWLSNTLAISDGIVCNSEETQESLKKFSDYKGLTSVNNLNIRPNFIPELMSEDSLNLDPLIQRGLEDKKFILTVGTLEPRKNHMTLINAWFKFQKQSPDACPYLVIVGRRGWLSKSIELHLENVNRSKKIIWLENITDQELEVLYRKCLFTVFLSRQEGWGLPVSESIAANKLCLVGKDSCALEATQGLMQMVDQDSERDVYQSIREYSLNQKLLLAKEEEIKSQKAFKTWTDLFIELIKFSDKVTSNGLREEPYIQTRRIYSFGRAQLAPLKGDSMDVAEHMRRGSNWNIPENAGNSICQKNSHLYFKVNKNGHYVCHIFLQTATDCKIELLANGVVVYRSRSRGLKLIIANLENIDVSKGVMLELRTEKMFNAQINRHDQKAQVIGCFWVELQLFEQSDLNGRMMSLERYTSML